MSSEQVDSAFQLLKEKYPDLVVEACKLLADDIPISSSLDDLSTRSTLSPTTWWKCAEKAGSMSSAMSILARKLHSMPAGSSSIERIFSNFSTVQTTLRNRLGLQKASKLVVCYRHLRGSSNVDW